MTARGGAEARATWRGARVRMREPWSCDGDVQELVMRRRASPPRPARSPLDASAAIGDHAPLADAAPRSRMDLRVGKTSAGALLRQ